MKLSDIKSEEMVLQYVEGLCNDLESGVSTVDETKNLILGLINYLIELDRKKPRCSEACDWPNCTLPGCVVKGEPR